MWDPHRQTPVPVRSQIDTWKVQFTTTRMKRIGQTCILNSQDGHTMCRSMVDIQSATAEIRRGKRERRKKKERPKPQVKNIMAYPIPQGGHKHAKLKQTKLPSHLEAVVSVTSVCIAAVTPWFNKVGLFLISVLSLLTPIYSHLRELHDKLFLSSVWSITSKFLTRAGKMLLHTPISST